MSQPQDPVDSADELQFAVAEPAPVKGAGPGTPQQDCLVCHQPIASTYFALADKVLCPRCCELLKAPPKGRAIGRLAKASIYGLGAGLVGAAIWFAVRKITHYEIGLVAVLVGFMVGKAVRKGSGGRGGRGYQVLAVVLTYCCIAANYMPDVFQMVLRDFNERPSKASNSTTSQSANASPNDDGAAAKNAATQPAVGSSGKAPAAHAKMGIGKAILLLIVAVVIVFVLSLVLPIMSGAGNIIGLLLIGFAMWEAWKFNGRRELPITGPYQFGTRPPGSGPAVSGVVA